MGFGFHTFESYSFFTVAISPNRERGEILNLMFLAGHFFVLFTLLTVPALLSFRSQVPHQSSCASKDPFTQKIARKGEQKFKKGLQMLHEFIVALVQENEKTGKVEADLGKKKRAGAPLSSSLQDRCYNMASSANEKYRFCPTIT